MHHAHIPARALCSALALVIMIALPIAGSHTRAAGSSGSWAQQAPRDALPAPPPYVEVQCPSTTVCYALGSLQSASPSSHPVLDTSSDGGVSWTEQSLNVDPYHWPD